MSERTYSTHGLHDGVPCPGCLQDIRHLARRIEAIEDRQQRAAQEGFAPDSLDVARLARALFMVMGPGLDGYAWDDEYDRIFSERAALVADAYARDAKP